MAESRDGVDAVKVRYIKNGETVVRTADTYG